MVLEAGRWAPSWANTQPWRFIVIKDKDLKERICGSVTTITNRSIKDSPLCIAVCVNTKKDPGHFVEDGAAATQNMALAAHSIGLGTCWIGVFSIRNEKESSERKIKRILKIPEDWRLISILPLGVPKFKETKTRKELSDLVDFNSFESREEYSKFEVEKKGKSEIRRILPPSSARELEPALV